jgi:aryl-alcohol dehydrogenase-like predicted oxidoreductase
VPIPGARKISHLEDNCAASDVELSAGNIAFLDAAAPVGAATGGRYPDALMKSIDA